MTYRAMTWTEKVLANHDDEQYGYDCYFAGVREVERSKWWFAWERFADSMQSLTERIENSSIPDENLLDTRDRIRDYGPRAEDTGSAATYGRNRGNDSRLR
jgi:hypothetical protein